MATPTANQFPEEYSQALDELVVQESFTSKYQESGAEFVSARTVKVPEMVIDNGTVDYDRFQTMNNAAIVYASYTLDKDRQTAFYLDAVDATDQPLGQLEKVAAEFERVKLVPEIDTYFFGKAKAAAKTSGKVNLTAANIREELRNVRTQMIQNGYNSADLYMSTDALACLENAIDREFSGEDNITDSVGRYNMFQIYEVPDERLVNDFLAIGNGATKPIRHVWKRAVSNLFVPGVNQNGDGYTLQMRWVYGTIALKNKQGGIYANKGTAGPDSSVKPVKHVKIENDAEGSGN